MIMKVKFILAVVAVCVLVACNGNEGGEEDVTSNSPNGSEVYNVNVVNVIEYGGTGDLVTVAAVSYSFNDVVIKPEFLIPGRSPRGTRAAETRAGGDLLASVPYVDKSFKLTLTTPDDSQLEEFPPAPPESTIEVSDWSARTTFVVEIEGRNASGEYIDDFWYETDDFRIYAQYMYADKDVDITGTLVKSDAYGTYSEKYDVHLKKGWNLTYYEEGFGEATGVYICHMYTELPAGKMLRWDFGFMD